MHVPLTVLDHLQHAATAYGNRVALIDEPGVSGSLGDGLTYSELERRARGMAIALEELGVGIGSRVAVISPNSGRFLTSFFGVSAFGRVLVPINYRLKRDEMQFIVDHSEAEVVIIDPEVEKSAGDVNAPIKIVLDDASDHHLFSPAGANDHPGEWDRDETALLSINYTSGTTAQPKGVRLTHRGSWLNSVVFGWSIGVSDRDVLLHTLPMFHCNGWGMPFSLTAVGGLHVVQRKIDGEEILRRIEQHGVTLMCAAPTVLAAILTAADERRSAGALVPGAGSVRVIGAGAPPPSKVIEKVEKELGWEFIQIYGLTETSPLLTINRNRSEWDDLDAGARAALLSRAGVPALGIEMTTSEDGEVLARGNHVFDGYWRDQEQTDESLRDGWFHTGDSGVISSDNHLSISDRKKDVIITGGENVSSIEVEDCIYRHPDVAEVGVIGIPDPKWGETILALVVLKERSSLTEQELISFCRNLLAHFKCPTRVEFRDSLVRTATGKLQKHLLRRQYWEGRSTYVAGG